MSDKARQYKRSTVRRLDTLSGNQCAAPGCIKPLIARDNESILSKICHIEAASKKGPRFNVNMDDEERRHYNNLILMCDECHIIIDNKENEVDYPVKLLKAWKKEHESKMIAILNSNTSLLKLAINAVVNSDIDYESATNDPKPDVFNIENKIEYNSIIRNKPLIDEYKVFYTKIASLYEELEIQGSFKKEHLLRNVRKIYLKTKGKYIHLAGDPLQAIQDNADNIIEDIEDELINSCDSQQSLHIEDISFGISVIMVDSFMRCKILEEPPKL